MFLLCHTLTWITFGSFSELAAGRDYKSSVAIDVSQTIKLSYGHFTFLPQEVCVLQFFD
jgi:hypothetical protein